MDLHEYSWRVTIVKVGLFVQLMVQSWPPDLVLYQIINQALQLRTLRLEPPFPDFGLPSFVLARWKK